MSETEKSIGESGSVIQEIEQQLEKLLPKKKEDIERALAVRIQEEKEIARKKVEEIEKDFVQEREALVEFRTMVAEVEAERDTILEEVRERIKRALQFQAEVESLSKQTAEEIRKVTDLQQKLESLRQRTAERAGFLKKDLRERFGIITEVPDRGEAAAPGMDLEQELEKLKRIKELLSAGLLEGGEEQRPLPEEENPWDLRIPEIQDLIQSSEPPEKTKAEDSVLEEEPGREAVPGEMRSGSAAGALDALERTDPVEGSGEIRYFQKGKKVVLDPEPLLADVERSLEDSKKLSLKIGETESAKDQFFIKHMLINGQEGLRKLVFRAVRMCEEKSCALPGATRDIINVPALKDLLERLSTENWANPDDLASFEKDTSAMRAAFLERAMPREGYVRSILEELEGG
jgi:hypothetical protein